MTKVNSVKDVVACKQMKVFVAFVLAHMGQANTDVEIVASATQCSASFDDLGKVVHEMAANQLDQC